jgi:hypothetical protein
MRAGAVPYSPGFPDVPATTKRWVEEKSIRSWKRICRKPLQELRRVFFMSNPPILYVQYIEKFGVPSQCLTWRFFHPTFEHALRRH